MSIRRTLVFAAVALAYLAVPHVATAQTAQTPQTLPTPQSAKAEPTVLKAADVRYAGYPDVIAMENLGRKFEAATGGRYQLKVFPGGVLGGDKQMVEQLQTGDLQIAKISLRVLSPVVPDLDVFNLPFLFRDEAHMRKVIDGPIGDELLRKITESPAKLIGLGWMDSGARSFYTKTPVRKLEDLKGKKVRVMGNPLFRDMMDALGGNAISIGYTEVLPALQSGVVDGAENNASTLYASNDYKAGIKYYTQTQHLIIPEIFVMSRLDWDKMAPADQALLKQFSREAQIEQRALWNRYAADYTTRLKAAGVEWIEVDKKPFYDATAAVRAKYGARHADLIERIKAVD